MFFCYILRTSCTSFLNKAFCVCCQGRRYLLLFAGYGGRGIFDIVNWEAWVPYIEKTDRIVESCTIIRPLFVSIHDSLTSGGQLTIKASWARTSIFLCPHIFFLECSSPIIKGTRHCFNLTSVNFLVFSYHIKGTYTTNPSPHQKTQQIKNQMCI